VALTSPSDSTPIHLQPRDYHLIGPEDLGSSGLVAREAVGPFAEVVALGPLVTVHDSRFDPRSGIGHHPHHGMERLFYIVEGRIDHEDRQNDIQGTMGTGDLGILTEGEAGMLHSERNEGDEPARAYILVYPADPLPDQAAFDAIRDDQMPRLQPGEGLHSKLVVGRDDERIHGQVHEVADSTLDVGVQLPVELEPGEGALVFCFDGRLQVVVDGADPVTGVGVEGTRLLAPPPPGRPGVC
jgi:redox-sensitive bicupin YhaK (pirin superfamily)